MLPLGHLVLSFLALLTFGWASECDEAWWLGNNFTLTKTKCGDIIVNQSDTLIWSASHDFLSASSGNDLFISESGNFNITKVDRGKCKGQEITSMDWTEWEDSTTNFSVTLAGKLLDCESGDAEYTANFWVPRDLDDRVAFRIDVDQNDAKDDPLTKVFLTYHSHADEDFFGLGAQAPFATLKNQSVPIFSREQGFGRGDQPTTQIQSAINYFSGGNFFTTYTAIPQYISTDDKAFYLSEESRAPAFFDFTEADAVTVRYHSLSVQGQFFRAESMLDAVGMVTDYTGRMPPLPEWVDEGAILGIQGGEDKVRKVIKDGLDADCPIAAVWLQDWSGTRFQETPTGINISRLWWNWESDKDLYPDWQSFVQSLRDEHSIRTLSYMNPFLANVSSKDDGFGRNLFEEADEEHYTIQNSTTKSTSLVASGPGIDAGILDLSNEDARKWFTDVLRDQVWNANISGYMADFGEYTPIQPDTALANKDLEPLVYHNAFPYEWAKYQRSVVRDIASPSDAVIFHRSASLGSSRYMNLFWAGDQNTAWTRNDGIKSVPSIMGQMGVSGFAQTHGEIGGYTSTFIIPTRTNPSGAIPRSAELLGRWGELIAVSSSVFRSHEGNIPHINAQPYTNKTTYAYFSHNARMFRALAPYRRRILDNESVKKGWPLLRLPVLYHPGDRVARNISSESFYLGSDLYVAPVMDAGVTELEVYLPGKDTNKYQHVWSRETFDGGQRVTVDAPYGQPPVFVVDGAKSKELDEYLNFVEDEKDSMMEI